MSVHYLRVIDAPAREPLPLVKPAELPDGADYVDTGCSIQGRVVADRCTACPLPECRYLMRPGVARMYLLALELRDHLRAGMSIRQAAAPMGISERSAYRVYTYIATLGPGQSPARAA